MICVETNTERVMCVLTDIDTGVGPLQLLPGQPGVLHGHVCAVQHHPLLRVRLVGLEVIDAEQAVVPLVRAGGRRILWLDYEANVEYRENVIKL